jgi:hypothetical protein
MRIDLIKQGSRALRWSAAAGARLAETGAAMAVRNSAESAAMAKMALFAALPLAFLCLAASPDTGVAQNPPGIADAAAMQSYLVQAVCLDAQGNPTAQLPIDSDCARSRPMTEDDPVRWRKFDWGGFSGPQGGWQASDAVLARRDGVAFVDQTFDFGAPARDNAGSLDTFRHFDTNDGGDALMVVGDTASVFLTQDGGSQGLQWFIGSGCSQPGTGRYIAWQLFKSDAGPAWRSVVAELRDVKEDTCPSRFGRAFTQYKLAAETYPFQIVDPRGGVSRRTANLPTVIAEHYDRKSLAEAHALERFYYAQEFGKVRWEAWSTDSAKAAQAEALQQSGRCAPLTDSTPPGDGWTMVDCRMWTNIAIEPDQPGWRVRDFNWPPADLKLQH